MNSQAFKKLEPQKQDIIRLLVKRLRFQERNLSPKTATRLWYDIKTMINNPNSKLWMRINRMTGNAPTSVETLDRAVNIMQTLVTEISDVPEEQRRNFVAAITPFLEQGDVMQPDAMIILDSALVDAPYPVATDEDKDAVIEALLPVFVNFPGTEASINVLDTALDELNEFHSMLDFSADERINKFKQFLHMTGDTMKLATSFASATSTPAEIKELAVALKPFYFSGPNVLTTVAQSNALSMAFLPFFADSITSIRINKFLANLAARRRIKKTLLQEQEQDEKKSIRTAAQIAVANALQKSKQDKNRTVRTSLSAMSSEEEEDENEDFEEQQDELKTMIQEPEERQQRRHNSSTEINEEDEENKHATSRPEPVFVAAEETDLGGDQIRSIWGNPLQCLRKGFAVGKSMVRT